MYYYQPYFSVLRSLIFSHNFGLTRSYKVLYLIHEKAHEPCIKYRYRYVFISIKCIKILLVIFAIKIKICFS